MPVATQAAPIAAKEEDKPKSVISTIFSWVGLNPVSEANKEALKPVDSNVPRPVLTFPASKPSAPDISPWIRDALKQIPGEVPPATGVAPSTTKSSPIVPSTNDSERQLMPPPSLTPTKPKQPVHKSSPLAIKNIQDRIVSVIRQFIAAVQGNNKLWFLPFIAYNGIPTGLNFIIGEHVTKLRTLMPFDDFYKFKKRLLQFGWNPDTNAFLTPISKDALLKILNESLNDYTVSRDPAVPLNPAPAPSMSVNSIRSPEQSYEMSDYR